MEKIKRVLCLISAMNAGGAETFLMKMYRNLDKTKYQMDFCVNVPEKGYYDDEIRKLGGKIYIIPSKSENINMFKKGLSDIICSEKYEYVFRITSNAMGFLDLKVAKDCGVKRCIARSSNSSDGDGLKVWVAHRLGRLLYNRYVDVKIAPSDLAAKYTFGKRAYAQGKVNILHNAVDLSQYTYRIEERNRIRKEFGIGDCTLIVGHIGRFSKQKNHEFLIDIYKDICHEIPDSCLILVGTGELQENIKNKVRKLGLSDKVIFTGVRSDISSILSALDVFVFPSLYEGMPNTVIEAQATGLPCIISDAITKEADITGLVKYKSLENTADEWAKEAVESAGIGRKNTVDQFIQQGYDINSVVRKFEDIIFE